jgi:hypothetical protein
VFGDVGIDMLAGPSEVVVIADAAADPAFAAADLLAQAEHDPMARSVLLSPVGGAARPGRSGDASPAGRACPGREIAASALEANGALVLTASLEEAVDVANRLAPEHLELLVAEPDALLARVRTRGRVFLGGATPEVVGDYVAGPNHVLPTGGTARFASALSTEDFMKRLSVIRYTARGLAEAWPHLAELARVEGLAAHGAAAQVRIETRGGTVDDRQGPGHGARDPAAGPRGAQDQGDADRPPARPGRHGASKVETTIPFFNHMLEAWSKHGLMDLRSTPSGDIDVDLHHTVEDVGICLGKALKEALGDKRGIVRYGASFLPMDETLLHARWISPGAVPGLQRAAAADADRELRPRPPEGLLPRRRLQCRRSRCTSPCTTARTSTTSRRPPSRRWPRPRGGHPARTARLRRARPPRAASRGKP